MTVQIPTVDILLVTPEEAARRLSVGRSKVYQLIRKGQLSSIKVGGSRRISARALRECVERLEAEVDTGVPG